MVIKPIPKPSKPKRNQGKSRWTNTRKRFLKTLTQTHRGGYICGWCGRETDNPEIHHIEERSKRPELVHELSNLVPLCFYCHQEYHHGRNR